MIATLEFTVTAPTGGQFKGIVRVKQLVGSNFEKDRVIEVGKPAGYEGPPLAYHPLQEAVTDYYYRCFGEKGMIAATGHVIGTNNVVMLEVSYDLPLAGDDAGGW